MKHAPMNHLHKLNLIEAEYYRVQGQKEIAKDFYKKAIDLANVNEYIQEEALSYELYSKFLLNDGKKELAVENMKKARYCYSIWGAAAKVSDLEINYPELLKEPAEIKTNNIDLE